MTLRLMWRLGQVGLVTSAVAFSVHQGVWGPSNDGSQLLQTVRTTVLPAANDYFKEVPTCEEVNHKVVTTWNNGIQKMFDGVVVAPEKITDYSKKAVLEIKRNFID